MSTAVHNVDTFYNMSTAVHNVDKLYNMSTAVHNVDKFYNMSTAVDLSADCIKECFDIQLTSPGHKNCVHVGYTMFMSCV